MGIFKSFTKILKKAAPVIGGSIGFAFGGPVGAALGSGIGSLASGRDLEDSLKAAALGGIAGYAGSKFFGPAQGVAQATEVAAAPSSFGFGAAETLPTQIASTTPMASAGIMGTLKDFATSPTGILTLGGLGTLAALGSEDEKQSEMKSMTRRPYPVGRTRLGTGLIDGKTFNLDDEEERAKYFKTLRERQGAETLADGGEVEGPGTGTSDSVPAMLSDGEFVLTAKAVRGAGGGDRDVGAARMYDMMSELERVA